MNKILTNISGKKGMSMRFIKVVLIGALTLAQSVFASERLTLQQVEPVMLPGDELELHFRFDAVAPTISTYQIDKPARIVFDIPNTKSEVARFQSLGAGNARSLNILDTQEKTRVILSLVEQFPYSVSTSGNEVIVKIGRNVQASSAASVTAMPSAQQLVTASPSSNKSGVDAVKSVQNVDFRRGEKGDGQVLIDLSSSSVSADVQQQGNKIIVKFLGAKLPENLRRRLDVVDFATPVKTIDAYNEGSNGVMVIQPQGEFEYLAYQSDKKLTISVKPINKEDKRNKEFDYAGEKLSLNFQDIEVRSVLQLIADFTSLNLVASDSVNGKITLRLQNVPWDQALDLILRTKGLDKRTVGNVMLVAPAGEIAEYERLEVQRTTQSEKLSPLRTEFIQVNYAKAVDLLKMISGTGSKLLSERGNASFDARTNTLVVADTAPRIQDVRDMVKRLDIPVKQVMIESRIVLATTSFAKQLGVQWQGGRIAKNGVAKTIDNLNQMSRGETILNSLPVDLGVTAAGASSIALGLVNTSGVRLDLQLSALQSDGNGEVVSTPKVLTADKQKARIATGKQIPFQKATSSGATAIEFVNAELSLEVTPNITPDGRIIMDLLVNDDSLGEVLANGAVTINTNRIATNVLVNDGQTVVLGGVFTTTTTKGVIKVPFLGDIPFIGRLFRREITQNDKQELLIFITPRISTDVIATSK